MASQSRIVDSGSNYQFYDKKIDPNVKRSSFDVSYLNLFTADCGYCYPSRFDFYQLNETRKLSQKALVRMPNNPVVPLMSRIRMFSNTYAVNFTSIWDKFGTFMTKGYTGSVVGVVPRLHVSSLYAFASGTTLTSYGLALSKTLFGSGYSGSLLDFFGIRLPYHLSDETALTESSTISDLLTQLGIGQDTFDSITIPLLPFMAYWRIMRDYMLNRNLIPSDIVRDVFTDSDADFRLTGPIDCVYSIGSFGTSGFTLGWLNSSDVFTPVNWSLSALLSCYISSPSVVDMFFPLVSNWADDYFTTATFTPQRGESPTVSAVLPDSVSMHLLTEDNEDLGVAYVNLLTTESHGYATSSDLVSNIMSTGASAGTLPRSHLINKNAGEGAYIGSVSNYSGTAGTTFTAGDPLSNLSRLTLPSTIDFGITMSDLRALVTSQLIQEKSMRTDGSYREFGKTFFDRTPKNADDYRPDYVGGCYQPLVFTEVLQTSATASGSQLGRQTGHGISSDSSFIGTYNTSDFGYLITLTRFVPDTYYSQGQIRWLNYEVQEDFPLPDRMELGQQAILNKELYADNSDGLADDVYGYQSIFDELRYRANEVHCQLRDPNEIYWSNFTQARFFSTRPTLSLSFVRMDKVSKDWLVSQNEPSFVVQVLNEDIAVKPMPYKSIPGGLV